MLRFFYKWEKHEHVDIVKTEMCRIIFLSECSESMKFVVPKGGRDDQKYLQWKLINLTIAAIEGNEELAHVDDKMPTHWTLPN